MELDVLKNAIARVLQVYKKEISVESTFECDLGADSIDMVQILRLVEEELKLHIDCAVISEIKTVGDALLVIEKAKEVAGKNE